VSSRGPICFSRRTLLPGIWWYSIILLSFLCQLHNHFHSQFSTQCDLVLPLSVSSILSFPSVHPVTAVFFSFFPTILSFLISFLHWRILEDSFYVRSDESSFPSFVLLCTGYPFAPWCNVFFFSFSTWWVQLIGYERNMNVSRPKVRSESAVAEAVRGLRYVFGCPFRLSTGAHSTDFLYDSRSPQTESVLLH